MLSVALTGNVASGKSTVARLWREAGVPVVSADDLARTATEPGSEGLREVVAAFGEDVLDDDGTLDRAALRDVVFRDEDARRRLEAILHPRIRALRQAWLEDRREEGAPLVVSEIPLLFETGMETEFDVVVLVDAPREERLRRLVEDRGLGADEAERIMDAQMDPTEKRRRADVVVENDGTLQDLRVRALAVLDLLGARAEGGARDEGAGGRGDGSRADADVDAAGGGGGAAGLRGGKAGAAEATGPGDAAGSEDAMSAPPPAGTLRLDLHNHTRASHDCLTDPRALVSRAREGGLDRLAITDHDTLAAALELADAFPDAVIPGEEVRTAEGIDVIGLYLGEEIPRGTPARETCRRIREQGGLVYLPHPFARGKGGSGRFAEELAPLVDVVEVFNARLHPGSLNEPAVELARRHGLPAGAGSDAHTLGEVAGAFVEVPPHPNEPAALLEALERARVHGTTAPWRVHLASTWAKVRKRLPGAG